MLATSFTGCVVENDSTSEPSPWESEGSLMVWGVEGDFAPDPNQDEGAVIQVIEDMISNPLLFQETVNNVSWSEYQHNFAIESAWQANYLILLLTVDYSLGNTSGNPTEGPAGSLNISIMDPNGGEHADGYEIVVWGNDDSEINERMYILPPMPGTWTVLISGSGMEGIGALVYSGDYKIRVEADTSERDGSSSF